MTLAQHLDAVELHHVDYIHWRITGHDLEDVPDDPFDRWLWIVHGYADWLTDTEETHRE